MYNTFKINEKDNVAVVLPTNTTGEIPAGHKVALCDIKKDEPIIKYGFPIGKAKCNISKGEHIHCHNLYSDLKKIEGYEYNPHFTEMAPLPPKTFMGFRRKNGKVGIRNEVWIIPTVGCVNAIAKAVEEATQKFKTDNIDGIFSYSHPYGCSQLGDDQLNTQKMLCGLINHPNAAGVLVMSLGCENNNLEEMKKVLGDYDPERVKFLVCQDVDDEISEGVRIVSELCQYADSFKREKCDASDLVIGLKCGGSDGFSGITANPLVGKISDRLISMGGSAILTEVPEMFGAETILFNRCRNKEVFSRAVKLINDFKDYFESYGEPIDENPSPGNKAGGISTLADKALGCTQKGGNAPVEDVLSYGEPVSKKGLSLLQSPGNDLVAACALASSGAHIVLFTTGRGTPFGCPVPTLKISTNSNLAQHKKQWIDFNAGVMLEGEDSKQTADRLFELIIEVAEGKKTKSEFLDKRDLSIFKDGVTL
ncbi:MAG: altronate dehydratase family protein [Acutalibacteraceae bacterium]|nr:altronate dehydratase family protein [Acutalibacteraceae bacterium]